MSAGTPETPKLKDLPPGQRRCLDAIVELLRTHGRYPKVREVMAALGLSSLNGLAAHYQALVSKGWLTKRPYSAGGICLTEPARQALAGVRVKAGRVVVELLAPCVELDAQQALELANKIQQAAERAAANAEGF